MTDDPCGYLWQQQLEILESTDSIPTRTGGEVVALVRPVSTDRLQSLGNHIAETVSADKGPREHLNPATRVEITVHWSASLNELGS